MSESELPNPPEISPQPDPLLDSDSFIQPDETANGNADELPPDTTVIAAEPISMVTPEEASAPSPKPVATRRNPEEMAKRPSWLPEDWKIDLRVRTSGATAGLIDRYYVSPQGRKCRSKVEVDKCLAKGDKPKRKADEAGAGPSASPPSQQKKKSAGKRGKSAASNEAADPPQET